MTDGQVFRANSFLQPGWQLEMPATSGAAGGVRPQSGDSAAAAGEHTAHVVTVQPGDFLSKIAQEELGDGDAWPQLFEASRGTRQPGGLPAIADPDVIYAGQQVTVPGVQPDGPSNDRDQGDERARQETAPPAPHKPDAGQEPGGGNGEEQAPVPSLTTAPAPESSAPSTPASRPAQQPGQEQALPSTPASVTPRPGASVSSSTAPPSTAESSGSGASSATTASEPPATAPASSPLNLRTVFGAGALLAAAITGALALRRTLQRRRRKPGEKIAIASETSPAEAQLAATAEPSGAARLDIALRTLAHQLSPQPADPVLPPPPLRAARPSAAPKRTACSCSTSRTCPRCSWTATRSTSPRCARHLLWRSG